MAGFLVQALDIAHASFHQKGAERKRWRALVQSNSLVGLAQHAHGHLPAAMASMDAAQAISLASCTHMLAHKHTGNAGTPAMQPVRPKEQAGQLHVLHWVLPTGGAMHTYPLADVDILNPPVMAECTGDLGNGS